MFNLFKSKKYKKISEYPESWSIIDERPAGNPALVRVNLGYKDIVGHSEYPIKVGIAIPVENQDKVIMGIKGEIEDYLDNEFLKRDKGALVAIITGLGDKKFIEFLCYTKQVDVDFENIHKTLMDKFSDYDVQMYADKDPKWDAYKSFAHL